MIVRFSIVFIITIFNVLILKALIINYTVYDGIYFNFSTPEIKENQTMCWLQASNTFTYGIALPPMAGNEILLTGKHGTHYQLSVVSPELWSHTLSDTKCNQLFDSRIMAIIEVTKGNVSALSVNERVALVSTIARGAGLSSPQFVILTPTRRILFSPILKFHVDPDSKFYYFMWLESCGFGKLDESMKKLKRIAENIRKIVGNVTWFLEPFHTVSSSQKRKSRHKRFARFAKSYHIVNRLPDLKINVMQIMNFIIPTTVFQISPYPFDISVFQIINGSRYLLRTDKKSWIRFTASTRNIRFQPTIKDHGISTLHICTNKTGKNESCAVLKIIVTSLSPQVHQIHIREGRNDYIINYTLPLVWFRSNKVMKDSQIQITGVRASVPVYWGTFNSLLFLNISSVEGTVLEIMVDVFVNNQTYTQLELLMPLMSLAKSKIILYQFHSVVKWISYGNDSILLFQIKILLENMASVIFQLFNKERKIESIHILPIQIHTDPQNSMYIQNTTLRFDWTFSVNSELPSSCLLDPELIGNSLNNMKTKAYVYMNTTKVKNKIHSGCDSLRNRKTTSSFWTTSKSATKMLPTSTTAPTTKTKSPLKPILVQTLRISVECGKIFEYSLPDAISGIDKLKIVPVVFTGPTPDWIIFSNDNKQMSGVIAKNLCAKNEFQFKIFGLDSKKEISAEMKLLVEVVSSYPPEHKFQIELILANTQQFEVSILSKIIRHLSDYIRSSCPHDIECRFNISLLQYSIQQDSTIHVSLGYLENSIECPQTLGIFLQSQIIDKTSKVLSKNIFLSRIFRQYGLGELTYSNLLLKSVCKNKNIFPPDLGQKIVYNNIPSIVSLKPFLEFYNYSVAFHIDDRSKSSLLRENYFQWMKISNNSSNLFILASTEHVRLQPYIVELIVYPNVTHRILLPKIAIEVRNLMHHEKFYPFIRELNHQIYIGISTNNYLVDTDPPLSITLELCEMIDRYLRKDCAQVSKQDCGTDILVFVNSLTDSSGKCNISYNLSSLSVLMDVSSSRYYEINNRKIVCPLKLINQMEMRLKNALIEYRKTVKYNKVWNLEFINVLYMGACVRTETAYVKIKELVEVATPKQINFQKENKLYFENTQQMFLMATVIPACSFILITILLGVATACLLNRRNHKKNIYNAQALKADNFASPIYQSTIYPYYPPSKPLILQNEKPPQPPPDDEDEDNEILIPNIYSMKFYG